MYARALALEPASLEATEGLRRVVEGAGRLRAAAAALVRLAGLCRDPRRAAERFAEAALLFEAEGLVDDAAQAFLEVLRREPDDDEAFHRLQALAERWDRSVGSGAAAVVQAGPDPATRSCGWRCTPAGRRCAPVRSPSLQEAIHDHRRILAIEPDRADSLRFLGRQALEQGRPAAAVPFYERALAGSRRHGRRRRGAAGAGPGLRGGGSPRGRRARAPPGDRRPTRGPAGRERLISLALRGRDHALAIEQLQALEALTADRPAQAALAVRRGRLERDRRNDRTAALAAFRTALELDPLGEAAGELVATVGEGPLAPEDAAAANQVIASLRESLARDPLDVRRLECLRDLAALRGLGDLRDVAAQLLSALGVGVARGRARDLTRSVPLASLGAFGVPGSGGHGPGGLGREGAADERDLAAPVRGGGPHPRRRSRRSWAPTGRPGSRPAPIPGWPGRNRPASRWASPRCRSTWPAWTSGGWRPSISPRPAWCWAGAWWAGIPARASAWGGRWRWCGRRRRCWIACRSSDLELAWAAAAYLGSEFQDPRYDPAVLKAMAKRLAKALSRREVKSLQSYADTFRRETMDVSGWRQAVMRAADRFGLLAGGDLAVALRMVTGRPRPGSRRCGRPRRWI